MPRKKTLPLPESLTNWLRFFLDECLPPILRDRRWFYVPLVRIYSPKLDVDFKVRAPTMSDDEFREAYERLYPMTSSDMTRATTQFVLEHLVGDSVLEVGCGGGDVAVACAEQGHRVMATDLAEGNLEALRARKVNGGSVETRWADAEELPFADASFDTTVCLHVLEHVRDLTRAMSELKRVTRKRLVIIVPKERYHRYSANYHLHFFGGPEQLLLALNIPDADCVVIDQALCFSGDIPS